MSKMRIEAQPALEAYIGESGDVCLKQESFDGDDKVISIPPGYVEKVVTWLQILDKERQNIPDDADVVDG